MFFSIDKPICFYFGSYVCIIITLNVVIMLLEPCLRARLSRKCMIAFGDPTPPPSNICLHTQFRLE